MSNVDLSQEFSDMIITQRGFQANSRIITTSDTMLEEIVNASQTLYGVSVVDVIYDFGFIAKL